MPTGTIRLAALASALCAMIPQARPADRPGPVAEPALSMSPAVACKTIDGYEQFQPLTDAAITADEKLKVYYRPIDYRIDRKGKKYVARFAQDGVVRRKGEKKVVWKKDHVLEYEAMSDDPPYQVYLTNLIGLKGLPPGEYELTITLRDALREGSSASQVLPFRIIPTPPAEIDPTPTAGTPR